MLIALIAGLIGGLIALAGGIGLFLFITRASIEPETCPFCGAERYAWPRSLLKGPPHA